LQKNDKTNLGLQKQDRTTNLSQPFREAVLNHRIQGQNGHLRQKSRKKKGWENKGGVGRKRIKHEKKQIVTRMKRNTEPRRRGKEAEKGPIWVKKNQRRTSPPENTAPIEQKQDS